MSQKTINEKKRKAMSAFELAKHAAISAKRFLESDTPAANATKTILAIAALAPIAVAGAMAPHVLQLLKPYARTRVFSKKETSYALQLLDRSKYVCIVHHPSRQTEIRITKKGMKQARKLCLETIKLSRLSIWDGKWHLFFYDIPVTYNAARLALRDAVADLGMCPLQKSLWAYPYPCEAEILFVADFFGVGDYINFAVADSLLDEDELLKFFSVKKP